MPARRSPPTVVELDGRSAEPLEVSKNGNESRLIVLPRLEEGNEPPSQPQDASTSAQSLPILDTKKKPTTKKNISPKKSTITVELLLFEMREPQKIHYEYVKTGVIDIEVRPEALDEQGNYTWMHCWGLFSVYSFTASYVKDAKFADRIMDILRDKIQGGKAVDKDTIKLIFMGRHISSRLKMLVADRCLEAGAKNSYRRITKAMPKEFVVLALKAATDRLKNCEWLSPYRYHRHKSRERCYLSKWAKVCDRRVIANRKARKGRNSPQVLPDLNTIEFKLSSPENVEKELDSRFKGSTKTSDEANKKPSGIQEGKKRVETTLVDSIPVSESNAQELELDTSESSIMTVPGLEEATVLTATSCRFHKPKRAIPVVNVSSKRPKEKARCSYQRSNVSLGVEGAPSPLQPWPRFSQLSAANNLSLPEAYPESVVSC